MIYAYYPRLTPSKRLIKLLITNQYRPNLNQLMINENDRDDDMDRNYFTSIIRAQQLRSIDIHK